MYQFAVVNIARAITFPRAPFSHKSPDNPDDGCDGQILVTPGLSRERESR